MSRLASLLVQVAAVIALATAAGCSFTPIQEATKSADVSATEPEALAFNSDDAPAAGSVTTPQPGALLLQDVEAAAWTITSSSDQIGVHSAPGSLYTRIGELGSDNDVIATGRRAAVDGDAWMEIHWANSTAWVLQAPFVPLDQ
jgi:hypothetical protein